MCFDLLVSYILSFKLYFWSKAQFNYLWFSFSQPKKQSWKMMRLSESHCINKRKAWTYVGGKYLKFDPLWHEQFSDFYCIVLLKIFFFLNFGFLNFLFKKSKVGTRLLSLFCQQSIQIVLLFCLQSPIFFIHIWDQSLDFQTSFD